MTSTGRTRTRGGLTGYSWSYSSSKTGVLSSGTVPAVRGSYSQMSDVVTRPFIPAKTIVNNAMSSYYIERQYSFPSGMHIPIKLANATYSGDAYWMADLMAQEYGKRMLETNINLEPLSVQAATQALSRVSKPEVYGLAGIAELRETISGLLNPLRGALKMLDGFTPSRRKQGFKKRAGKIVSNAADTHLSIIFGLLPFISDIRGILKVLREYEPKSARYTARGEASTFSESSGNVDELAANGSQTLEYQAWQSSAKQTATVRAYVLYECEVSLEKQLGVSLSDAPLAAFQVVPLSFIADWFVNVSEFISALTPVAGVHYLASGLSTTLVTAYNGSGRYYLNSKTGLDGYNGSYENGTDVRVIVTKSRQPGSLHGLIGLAAKRHMDRDLLDTYKITAGISLITQRLSRIIARKP